MTSASQEQSRSERLREYDQLIAQATQVVTVMGAVVRAREARGWHEPDPPEVTFAAHTDDDGRALPAGVFVALRRDDAATVLDALNSASEQTFLVARREEMGEGYRLQTVDETRPLPDVELMLAQLSAVLGIPADVLDVLGQWGVEDPRTAGEVNALLDSRLGAAGEPVADVSRPVPRAAPGTGELTMSVQETADVLQLTDAQAKVLATLVRRAAVTITA